MAADARPATPRWCWAAWLALVVLVAGSFAFLMHATTEWWTHEGDTAIPYWGMWAQRYLYPPVAVFALIFALVSPAALIFRRFRGTALALLCVGAIAQGAIVALELYWDTPRPSQNEIAREWTERWAK
jgi:disulfide bond formation protein DsbB